MTDRTYVINGITYVRITKEEAKERYENNLDIILAPVNANLASPWIQPYYVNIIDMIDEYVREDCFSLVTKRFMYDVPKLFGKYCAYYMEVNSNASY